MLGFGRIPSAWRQSWRTTAEQVPASSSASASPAMPSATAIHSVPTATTFSRANSRPRASTGACRRSRPRAATRAELELFHLPAYIDLVQARSLTGEGYLDAGDTPAFKGVYEAACDVVGASLVATEALMTGSGAARIRADRGPAPRLAWPCRRFLCFQRLRRRRRVPEEGAWARAHRLHRHRCAPWRRRLLRFRGRSGADIRRPARGRTLPVPGHRRQRGNGYRAGARHEAESAIAARCRRSRSSSRPGRPSKRTSSATGRNS